MTAHGEEKAALLLHGLGDNGKTILLEILLSIFGYTGLRAYGASTPWDSFAVTKFGGSGIRNDIAKLHNARLVVCDESSRDMELHEGTFKAVTGNSAMTVRFLNHEYFTFVAGFKLVMATNTRPRIIGNDPAVYSRIKDIPLNQSFPLVDPRRIENLKVLLMAERAGIAAWMVRGYKQFVELGGLCAPDEIIFATKDYQAHSDTQGEFLSDCCYVSKEFSVPLSDVYQKHQAWCTKTGERGMTLQDFRAMLEGRGFKVERRRGERGRPQFVFGLAILESLPKTPPSDFQQAEQAA
jgi:putative DNA primase/helicase